MSEYRVNLDVFAGPLDLLLYLVRKEEVDIYDIPIARVTRQYVEYIEMLQGLDIDLAGDFLVMAATLMEIKSAMLLPSAEESPPEDGTLDDPRAELVRQLLEYKRFKDAANMLGESAEVRGQRFTRPGSILDRLRPSQEPEVDLDQVSIWTLLEAFDGIMKATGQTVRYGGPIKDDTPIDLYQIEILHRLQTDGPLALATFFEGRKNRLTMIGLFLGMLELIRNRLVCAEQPELHGPILLKSLTSEPAEEAVQKAIYAERAEEEEHFREEATSAKDAPTDAVEAMTDDEEAYDYELDDASRAELSAIKDVEIDISEFEFPKPEVGDNIETPQRARIPIVGIGPSPEDAAASSPKPKAVEKNEI